MNWEAQKQKRLFKQFYEKTGIQLTDEPMFKSDWEKIYGDGLYWEAQERPHRAIPKLEKAIKQHPELPSLKNYLYSAYMLVGEREKANIILEQTIEEHPTYVFGVTNKILNTRGKKELLKIGHLLGEPRDIRTLTGQEETIHISAFKCYQESAAHYEMSIGENDAAVQRLESLMDLEIERPFLERMAKNLALVRIARVAERMKARREKIKHVKANQKVFLKEQTEIAPTLNHEELDLFYELDTYSLSEEQQATILALPRATLIEDLENIVEDAMKRWAYFKERPYDRDTCAFPIHALYFLGALKSEKSLPKVLNLLRMGKDFIEYWFNNSVDRIMYAVLYPLGEQQLDQLKTLALERNVYAFNKIYACRVVSQIALHQPSRREEMVRWFQEVFQTFLDNPTDDDLIDTSFLSWAMNDVKEFRAKELLPLVEQLWEKNWIEENIIGDLTETKKLITEDFHPSEVEPLPKDIHEYYSGSYLERKIKHPESEVFFQTTLEKLSTKGERLITKFWAELMYGNIEKKEDHNHINNSSKKSVVSVKNDYGKVGRNEPCPCGSGKKYKKCCLRKK